VIKKLDDWMVLVSGVDIMIQYSGSPSSGRCIPSGFSVEQLPQGEVVVTGISGPVENEIQTLKQSLPSNNNIILFCGLLGVIVGLVGMFIDSIIQGLKAIKDRLRKKE
jgi:hypothetical protein